MMTLIVWQLKSLSVSTCGISVLSPDVNESFIEFAVVPNEVKSFRNVGCERRWCWRGWGSLRAKMVRLHQFEDFARRVSAGSTGKPGSRLLSLVRLMIWAIDLTCYSIWILTVICVKLQKEAIMTICWNVGWRWRNERPIDSSSPRRLLWNTTIRALDEDENLLGLYLSASAW